MYTRARAHTHTRGPFAKFLDSSFYSELELCGGAMIISFFDVPLLRSYVVLTTLHPLLENVLQTICRRLQEDSGTGSFDLLITSLCFQTEDCCSLSHYIVSISLMDELKCFRTQSRNTDAPLRK